MKFFDRIHIAGRWARSCSSEFQKHPPAIVRQSAVHRGVSKSNSVERERTIVDSGLELWHAMELPISAQAGHWCDEVIARP